MPDDRRRLPPPRRVGRVDRLGVQGPDVRRVVRVLRWQPLAVVDRPALVVQKRRRDARLLAPEHLEPSGSAAARYSLARRRTPAGEMRPMVWDVDPAVWRQRACDIVGRNLSREEWELYLPAGTEYRPTCTEWPTG